MMEMRQESKKFSLSALVFLVFALFSVEAGAEKKIGVLLFSDEARYAESQRGMMDKLTEEGFGPPGTKYVIANAKGSKVEAMKVVGKFAAERMDMILTLGTSASIIAAKEIRDVPIVFSQLYDPVDAGVAKDWKSSGNNTTGSSPRVPMSKLVEALEEFAPVKKLAVLYTPGEKNSESQLKDLQRIQEVHKIKIIPVPLTRKEEVSLIVPNVLRNAEAIYISGSNLIDGQISIIIELASKAKVPTISHLEDLVRKGVLLGVCSNPYVVGRMAGEKAAKILRGAKPSSIPIEAPKKFDVILNLKAVKDLQFKVPPEFMKKITRTIE